MFSADDVRRINAKHKPVFRQAQKGGDEPCASESTRTMTSTATTTSNPEIATKFAGHEKEIHKTILNYCALHGIVVIRARMDRKSTLMPGVYDFTLLKDGRGMCIECKTYGGKCSPKQIEFGQQLYAASVPHKICYSDTEAIEFIKINLLVST